MNEKTEPNKITNEVVAIIYDRDGYCCRVCGSFNKLEIHHIIRKGLFVLNDFCNLILLCAICHDFVEAGKLPHWSAQSTDRLYHISPVKGFIHSENFDLVICRIHKLRLSLDVIQPPIRAYAYKNQNPVFQ